MSRHLTFPAIVPVRNVTEAELGAAARASLPLQAGRRLADWFGDAPVDAQSGWRSPRAQWDAALELGLVAGGGGAMTDGRTSRLHWIYEVAYHAGYVHTSEDHELIHRAAELSGGAVRTDAQIITDWCRALDAVFAHGVERALPREPILHRWTSTASAGVPPEARTPLLSIFIQDCGRQRSWHCRQQLAEGRVEPGRIVQSAHDGLDQLVIVEFYGG